MTETTKEKLIWTTIDMSSDPQMQAAFEAAREAYVPYKAAKDFAEELALDKARSEGLLAQYTLKFGYRFGPPATTIVPAKAKTAKKGAKSIADQMLAAGFKPVTTLIKSQGGVLTAMKTK